MRRNIFSLLIVLVLSLALAGCTQTPPATNPPKAVTPSPVAEFKPYTAQFEIYTHDTKRIFSDSRYHNQSQDVYLEASDPSIIHVAKADITWSDFFKTLPMSVTKDCLVTGTKQTFCSNQKSQLKFYLNDQESSEVLDQKIKARDFLSIKYSSI